MSNSVLLYWRVHVHYYKSHIPTLNSPMLKLKRKERRERNWRATCSYQLQIQKALRNHRSQLANTKMYMYYIMMYVCVYVHITVALILYSSHTRVHEGTPAHAYVQMHHAARKQHTCKQQINARYVQDASDTCAACVLHFCKGVHLYNCRCLLCQKNRYYARNYAKFYLNENNMYMLVLCSYSWANSHVNIIIGTFWESTRKDWWFSEARKGISTYVIECVCCLQWMWF